MNMFSNFLLVSVFLPIDDVEGVVPFVVSRKVGIDLIHVFVRVGQGIVDVGRFFGTTAAQLVRWSPPTPHASGRAGIKKVRKPLVFIDLGAI